MSKQVLRERRAHAVRRRRQQPVCVCACVCARAFWPCLHGRQISENLGFSELPVFGFLARVLSAIMTQVAYECGQERRGWVAVSRPRASHALVAAGNGPPERHRHKATSPARPAG